MGVVIVHCLFGTTSKLQRRTLGRTLACSPVIQTKEPVAITRPLKQDFVRAVRLFMISIVGPRPLRRSIKVLTLS